MDSVCSCISELSSVLACHPAVYLSIETLHCGCICRLCASFCRSVHVCERVCVCVCVCVCAPLTPSLINVRGLRQALHAAFGGDRQILGPPAAPGVRVGTMHDASTKTALLLIKQMFRQHSICFVLDLFKEERHFGSGDAKGTTPLFLK